MFKSKKTQFAIRKLSKGAAAVLLSFGILANTAAPLVSAATINENSEQVEDKTENDESKVKDTNTAQDSHSENTNQTQDGHGTTRGSSDPDLLYHKKEKQYSKSIRTITGKTPTGEEINKRQTVNFWRYRYYCTYSVPCKDEFSEWENSSQITQWASYEIPEFDGYDIYINGEKAASNVINEATPKAEQNETLNITYVKKADQPIEPDNPKDPAQKDFFKTFTRKITIKYADGKTEEIIQEAIFYQTKTGDKFNNDWKAWKGQNVWSN
ncbi:hypothetical protein [uncultured Lactobacillus sp.]|uniref:hypothetical protein n=1 Tax=uncultured Lactobacillus sp. TaxID=153152 RepID=UPI00260C91C3|nr:hypothetical protein [uncultured Lactobacillus sp.]